MIRRRRGAELDEAGLVESARRSEARSTGRVVLLAQTGKDKDLPASSANMSESGSDAWTCSALSWSEISARIHDVATSPHDEVA